MNAAEIVGPTGASRASVCSFLTAIGPYWIPIEGTKFLGVMQREAAGGGHESCIANELLQKFRAGRSILLYGEQRNDVVGPDFFDLAHFLDFCHAIMTASYAQFATLDQKWKRRIENLPKPNGLAKVYFPPQLERFVADIEAALEAAPYVRTRMVVTDYGPDA